MCIGLLLRCVLADHDVFPPLPPPPCSGSGHAAPPKSHAGNQTRFMGGLGGREGATEGWPQNHPDRRRGKQCIEDREQRRRGKGGKRKRPCAPGPLPRLTRPGSDSLGSPNFKGIRTPPSCFPPLTLVIHACQAPAQVPRSPVWSRYRPALWDAPESQELREHFRAALSKRRELS